MDVKQRVQLCRLLEKANAQSIYSKKLGIRNESTFRGKKINKK